MRAARNQVCVLLAFVVGVVVWLCLRPPGCPPADFAASTPAAELIRVRQGIKDRVKQKDAVADLRSRAWAMLQAVTAQPAGCAEPRWRRWPDLAETFHEKGDASRSQSRPSLRLTPAREMEPDASPAGSASPAPAPPTFQAVHYNPIAYLHIQRERLYAPDRGAGLIREGAKDIQDFPPRSVIVKTFWRAVPQTQALRLGVWNWSDIAPQPGQPPPEGPLSERLWTEHVCVYQKLPPPQDAGCTDRAVSVDQFYSIVVGKGVDFSGKDKPSPGDRLILIGMHITTKEIPDWTWMTFWWGGGKPDDRGNAQRPRELKAPWNEYSMDATLSLFNREFSGPAMPQERATFNPYIEGVKISVLSNCMQCHSEARVGATYKAVDSPTVEHFEGCFRTDYMWAIANRLGNCDPRRP